MLPEEEVRLHAPGSHAPVPDDAPGRKKELCVLAVSDEESPYLYDHYIPGMLADCDLILACGDLRRGYLEFLATMANCPVFYVRGNHDDLLNEEPPLGCVCIDGRLITYQGLRILGLGGSFRYREGRNMYTEKEMGRRLRRLKPMIWKAGGVDILVTHAPARHINDGESLSHRGFQTFRRILDRYHPAYFVHGHIHRNYGIRIPRISQAGTTAVINACGYCVFMVPVEEGQKRFR